ncbi:MAG: hypothetical protein ABSD75_18805 [Terriglobales bacterium]|jgi:hypothetical protein
MQHEFDNAADSGEWASLLSSKALAMYFEGRVGEAREIGNSAAQMAEQQQLKEFASAIRATNSAFEAELGYPDEARRQLAVALVATDNKDIKSAAAIILGRLGDAGRAQKLIGDLSKEYPSDTLLDKAVLPIAQAMIELQRKQPARAVDALESARPFEMGGGPTAPADYWPLYLRGGLPRPARREQSAGRISENHRPSRSESDEPVVFPGAPGNGSRFRLAGRCTEGSRSLSGFFRFLERR